MKQAKLLLCAALLLIAPVALLAEDTDANPLNRLKVLRADGVGSSTSGDGAGHTVEGIVKGTVVGTANFKATFKNEPPLWPSWGGSSWSTNADGGLCVRGSGSIILTGPDGNIDMRQVGLSCHAGKWQDGNLLDAATYLIVGGTGRYSEATGTGNVVTGNKNGQVSMHFDGNIILPAEGNLTEDEEHEKGTQSDVR